MLLNLKKELMGVRQAFMAAVGQTTPAKEFGATLLMAMVGLHVTEGRIRNTQNFEERRRLINEFKSRRKTIEKAIGVPRKSSEGRSEDPGEKRRRAMP